MVDPDNRRPVDYLLRRQILDDIRVRYVAGPESLIADLLSTREDGRIKLFLTWRALQVRRENPEVFRGRYQPGKCSGVRQDNIIDLTRLGTNAGAYYRAPFFYQACPPRKEPLGREAWQDTTIEMPGGEDFQWVESFTGQEIPGAPLMYVGDILRKFPVALLVGVKKFEKLRGDFI